MFFLNFILNLQIVENICGLGSFALRRFFVSRRRNNEVLLRINCCSGSFLYEKGLLDRCRFMTCLYSEMPLFLRVAINCA